MSNIQRIIDTLKENAVGKKELESYLESKLVLVKVNAIVYVIRHKILDNNIINKLKVIGENINCEPIVLGSYTTGHFAIAALYMLNSSKTLKIFNEINGKLNEYDKESVIRLIKEMPYLFK